MPYSEGGPSGRSEEIDNSRRDDDSMNEESQRKVKRDQEDSINLSQ